MTCHLEKVIDIHKDSGTKEVAFSLINLHGVESTKLQSPMGVYCVL